MSSQKEMLNGRKTESKQRHYSHQPPIMHNVITPNLGKLFLMQGRANYNRIWQESVDIQQMNYQAQGQPALDI